MNANLTDITVVMDRSGSMASCRADAEGGLNTFIDEQKKGAGDAVFTLVQFDSEYEFIHKAVPIKDVPVCTLVPRGSTALLDALGRAITETGERLAAMDEAARPGLVVFVVITDGHENSSKEFKLDQIKTLIQQQESAYKWKFTYLGANQDAFAQGGAMGFAAGNIANYAAHKSAEAFAAASGKVGVCRSTGMFTEYSEDERKSMV